jgi:hypothetical protein
MSSSGAGTMSEALVDYGRRIESLAHKLGLTYYPVDFELVRRIS